MKGKILLAVIAIISGLALSSCAIQQEMHMIQFNSITIKESSLYYFNDLSRGLNVKVIPTQPATENTGYIYHMSGKSFYTNPTIKYVQSMGFTAKNQSTDYTLSITIEQAEVDGFRGTSNVVLAAKLQNDKGHTIYTQEGINGMGSSQLTIRHFGLDEAYTRALELIDWNSIASFLKGKSLAKDEPDNMVEGLGTTDLEQTIVRWDVQSRPQGADLFWRVTSKTPDVKSTNDKYLQTTPYEATKTLDIKGLTYQNSGNVSIILKCEMDGYKSQEKVFNARMILDQEEISAFFKLVKDE